MAACTQPEQVIVVVTATPTPEERVDDKVARNVASTADSPAADTPTPLPTKTSTPISAPTSRPANTPVPTNAPTLSPTGTPAPPSTPTQRPTDTPELTHTPTTMPTDTPTSVPTSTPTNTPTPVPTNTPASTNIPTPVPTSTPIPTNTPLPTNTPVPVVKLVLDAESTVAGYWSDGTADVEVTATLRNDGTLRLDGARDITATCTAQNDELRDCREELTLSLPDGFAPAFGNFTLRLPTGATTLVFDYGQDEPLTLDIDVPERILGVDRDLWECYADRPSGGVDGCGGWGTKTVEKWLNDVPVKIWATGDPTHIAVLETVLAELAPILNLEFEWVDSEQDADFKAFVGVPRSRVSDLGFDDDPKLVHYWGFASASVNGGEATSGYIVIWHLDLTEFWSPIDSIRSVTIHEALHALVPIGHSTRPVSIMGGSSLNTWSPLDRQLIELNSHPLVRPGMSMEDVRRVLVLTGELLDYPQVESSGTPDSLDLVWRTYVALEEAGSANFRLSGGWVDRACNHTFGVRRGPIEMSIGDFEVLGDDPALVHLDFGTSRFLIRYEDGEWLHWWLSPGGDWEMVHRNAVETASSYWLWNGKLHRAIRSVLMDAVPESITVDETADGNLRIHVTLAHSYVNLWEWDPISKSLDLTLVVDPKTFSLVGYTWELHRDPDMHSGSCLTYKEVATDGRLGVDMDKLIDQPTVVRDAASDNPLDIVWQAYLALERAGSASFRLSGGWVDRACNQTFGVRRGPIEMSIGDFRYFKNEPILLYLNLHTTQFYIIYSRADQEWTHWQLSPEGTWERVDHETVADASSWWVWNGKLHAAIRGVLLDASPGDVTVDETADGDLRIHVTLDEYYVNLWDWTPGDSVDFTLAVTPETFHVVGYTWELHKDPTKHPNSCLTYKEVATDGRLGVDIEVPESIRNQLAASP